MPSIKTLPAEVIAAIAAGEIVERPAVVIKELIENALDAGATTIEIYLENAGLDLIRVSDNGHGISTNELKHAIQRHSTSKIATIEDLSQIQTLGFRGEALASMAGVSELIIESRTADAAVGGILTVTPEIAPLLKPIGRPPGTTVTVAQLFANLPARLKFIQNSKTELRRCLAVVVQSALSHPSVRFIFSHHQKNVLTVPGHSDVTTRLATVLKQPLTQFYPLHFEHSLATVSGSLGLPQIARKSKQDQYLFVNGRPVTHLAVNRVVKEAYGSLLAPRQEPTFLLNITIPPDQVDVNVHPRKEQVAFRQEAELLAAIKQAVGDGLTRSDTTYVWPPTSNAPLLFRDRSGSEATGSLLKTMTQAWRVGTDHLPQEIAQLDLTYLIAPTAAGLVLVDQHAAHERILYEQFKAVFTSASTHQPQVTQLEPGVTLSLSPTDSQLLVDQIAVFEQLGFEIEPFGLHTFKINQVPTLLADRSLRTLLQEFLDDLHHDSAELTVDSMTDRTLAYLACRSAVKAGDYLTPDQRRSLLEKLAQTPQHATCPHGRPTVITMTISELEQMFKRK
jgi:DNA mismatch repair protein MutL